MTSMLNFNFFKPFQVKLTLDLYFNKHFSYMIPIIGNYLHTNLENLLLIS
jgi:hypothetical protein